MVLKRWNLRKNLRIWFENDVKMYGTQTQLLVNHHQSSLRMM